VSAPTYLDDDDDDLRPRGPETWSEAGTRLGKSSSDCQHEGVECEPVLTCQDGCTCQQCLKKIDEADDGHPYGEVPRT